MALKSYHPEMGEEKPEAEIEASLCYYGKHWFLRTPLTLNGRGIALRNTLTANQLAPQGQRLVGWNEYRVTERDFNALCEEYDVVTQMTL